MWECRLLIEDAQQHLGIAPKQEIKQSIASAIPAPDVR
jgi:hypothetical protein